MVVVVVVVVVVDVVELDDDVEVVVVVEVVELDDDVEVVVVVEVAVVDVVGAVVVVVIVVVGTSGLSSTPSPHPQKVKPNNRPTASTPESNRYREFFIVTNTCLG